MKPTPQQIDEQVELERDAIRQGLKRLRDQTIKLENQNYASATIYGISSIDSLLPDVAEQIDKTTIRIHKGSNGEHFKDVHQYLKDIDSQSKSAKKYLDKQKKSGTKTIYTIWDDHSVQVLHPEEKKDDRYVLFEDEDVFDDWLDEYYDDEDLFDEETGHYED